MVKDTGGPAFPVQERECMSAHDGMSLRDWFAGMALQGLLSGCRTETNEIAKEIANNIGIGLAYKMADAMIAERNKS